jgi:hypothetical protein
MGLGMNAQINTTAERGRGGYTAATPMTTPQPPADDRRSTARRACRLVVRYRIGAAWHPAAAVDVSTSGCRLRVGEDLPRGAAIDVVFASPEGTSVPEVKTSGQVIWCRLEGLSHQAGVHFSTSAPVDTLLAALP